VEVVEELVADEGREAFTRDEDADAVADDLRGLHLERRRAVDPNAVLDVAGDAAVHDRGRALHGDHQAIAGAPRHLGRHEPERRSAACEQRPVVPRERALLDDRRPGAEDARVGPAPVALDANPAHDQGGVLLDAQGAAGVADQGALLDGEPRVPPGLQRPPGLVEPLVVTADAFDRHAAEADLGGAGDDDARAGHVAHGTAGEGHARRPADHGAGPERLALEVDDAVVEERHVLERRHEVRCIEHEPVRVVAADGAAAHVDAHAAADRDQAAVVRGERRVHELDARAGAGFDRGELVLRDAQVVRHQAGAVDEGDAAAVPALAPRHRRQAGRRQPCEADVGLAEREPCAADDDEVGAVLALVHQTQPRDGDVDVAHGATGPYVPSKLDRGGERVVERHARQPHVGVDVEVGALTRFQPKKPRTVLAQESTASTSSSAALRSITLRAP
jgi:hypothetical protein